MHKRNDVLDWLTSLFTKKSKPVAPSLTPGFSFANAFAARQTSPGPVTNTSAAEKPQPVFQTAPQVTPPATGQPAAHEHVVELQGQLSEAIREREKLENELIAMRQRVNTQAQAPLPMRQASVAPIAPTSTTSVRVIAPDAASKAGLPHLTTFPNVVTGIIKDQQGNLLVGILITVRDKEGTPVRALKTNRLGQFAASTPLPNNTYVIEIEDPKGGFVFDKAKITLAGSVAPPIEVSAKSQRQVERDKLAREIFGNQPM